MQLLKDNDARGFVAARCDAGALDGLDKLVVRLKDASNQQNLVSASTLDSVWLRHIADSAQLLDHVSRGTDPWLDLGSGAGFPGLVIAIMRPELDVRLIESRRLRCGWLQSMADYLDLKRCRVENHDVRRVETFPAGVITARAFAPLPRLVQLAARFSTTQTQWILPKGRNAEQELALLTNPFRDMFHVKQSITSADAGIVIGRGRVEP